MQYLETENDDYIRHGDDEDQEVQYTELLVKEGLLEDQAAIEAKKAIAKTRMVPLVCSCGSQKCYAINMFGLPQPTFQEHIEPVFPQMSRDNKARRMKADLG